MIFKRLKVIFISQNFIHSADLGRVESLHENGLNIQFYDN